MSTATAPSLLAKTPRAQSRILIADDDRVARRLLLHWLGREGHEVVAASDGAEALEVLRADTLGFDLAILDIDMPRLDGIGLLSALRELDPELPVVLVTADASLPTALRGIELGVLQYLSKPLQSSRLLPVVDRGIAMRRRARARERMLNMVGLDDQAPPDGAALDAALEELFVVFQPIVDLERGAPFGFEALVRSGYAPMANPAALLAAAEKLGRLHELGRLVRARAAEVFGHHAPAEARLFVNLHPLELDDPALFSAEDPLASLGERVVFEITERVPLLELDRAVANGEVLRQRGASLAVDDLGSGFACLNTFAALRPEIVKLDMALTRNLDTRPVQRRIVAALVELAHQLDCRVVAEGVETQAEREALLELGCTLQQGYLYGRPERHPWSA